MTTSDSDLGVTIKLEPKSPVFQENSDANDDHLNFSDHVVKTEELPYNQNHNEANNAGQVQLPGIRFRLEAFNEAGRENEEDEMQCLSEPFCFESDHVALKNNPDYRRLLRAIVVLEAQRSTALRDLDTLIQLQRSAMDDPIAFVEKLQRNPAVLEIPRQQIVATLPSIAWEQYVEGMDMTLKKVAMGRGSSAPVTRNKLYASLTDKIKDESVTVKSECSSAEGEALSDNVDQLAKCEASSDTKPAKSRSVTFNQRWSSEEQRHFERLLRKYPPERNQSKRHAKIARELGTRTTAQVATHIQKYFIKLAERQLPVPGPVPHLLPRRRGVRVRRRHRNRYDELLAPSSTFLASYELPVYMSDNDDDYEEQGASADPDRRHSSSGEEDEDDDDDDDCTVPEYLKNSAEYLELKLLQRRKKRLQERSPDRLLTANHDRCTEMICSGCCLVLNGVAWHCVECVLETVYLCATCSKAGRAMGEHLATHLLERVDCGKVGVISGTVDDQDYMHAAEDTYSYLDPNYHIEPNRSIA